MNKTLLTVLAAATVIAATVNTIRAASGRFPSTDPNLRVGTPDDPDYDCAEADDEDGQTCAGDLFAHGTFRVDHGRGHAEHLGLGLVGIGDEARHHYRR